jgi:PAS domain S-box-containing protein
MKDERKTKEQLTYELVELRQRLARLEQAKAELKRVGEELRESSRMNQLLLDSLPHPAMLIRRNRIILGTNRIARDAGAEVGNYCWRSFGQSEYIPDEDKHYTRDNVNSVPPGGTKCTFCLADEAFDTNEPTNNPEVEAFGQLWDTWWVPVEDNIYLHYAINITERKRTKGELKWKHQVDGALAELYKPLISSTTSIEEMTISILNHTRKLTGSMHGYVSSIDPSTGDNISHTLTEMMTGDQCKVSSDDQRIVFPRGDDGLYGGLWGYSLNTLEPFFINSAETHPASTGIPAGHISIKCFLSVPVMIDEELVGQISLANKEEDYTERDLEAICRIGEFYALAIQRRRSEEAVRESETYLEGILMTAPIGIGLVHNRVFDWISDRMSSMLGYARDELIGKSARVAYESDKEFERVGKVKYAEIRKRGIGTVETRLKRKDGSVFDVLLSSCAYDSTNLSKGVISTASDITESKQAEEALRKRKSELMQRSKQLEEVNTALKVLLKRREDDKKEIEESLTTNIKELVLPQLERLRKSQLAHDQINLLDSLEANIKEIISPFATKLSSKFLNLTPSELQIASLIKYGRTTKEIAELLHLSPNTILFHRHNLRRKLGLIHEKANLVSYLRSFQN